MVNITIYKMTGKQLFFNVPEKICKECDLSVASVKSVAKKMNGNNINIEVKSWFNKMPQVLLKGGWHPPVVMINGKVFSQGIVPNIKELEIKIKQELNNENKMIKC